jgi:hypothetical protein
MSFRRDQLFSTVAVAFAIVVCGCSESTSNVGPRAQRTLSVVVSEGVTGSPSQGSGPVDKGSKVDYAFTSKAGFGDLVVTVNGNVVSSTGSFTCDTATTLVATASRAPNVEPSDVPVVSTASAIVSSTDAVGAFKLHVAALGNVFRSAAGATALLRVSEAERQAAITSTATPDRLVSVHRSLSGRTFWLPTISSGAAAHASAADEKPITYLYVNGILTNPWTAAADALAFSAAIAPIRSASDIVGLFYNSSWLANGTTPTSVCLLPLFESISGDASPWVYAQLALKCLQEHNDKLDLPELFRQLTDVELGFKSEAEPDAKLLAAAILDEVDQGRRVVVVAHSQGNLMTQQALSTIQRTAIPGLSPLPCIGVLRYAPPSSKNWIVESDQHLGGFVIEGDITRYLGANADLPSFKTSRSSALLVFASAAAAMSNDFVAYFIVPAVIHFVRAGYIENPDAKARSISDLVALQNAVRLGDGCGGAFKVILASSGQDNGDGPSQLFLVPPSASQLDQPIATIATPSGERPPITDLAWCPGGRLFGVSYDRLFAIIQSTGLAVEIANHGRIGANALTCDPNGNLYMGAGASLYRFAADKSSNVFVGAATNGRYSGDIAFNKAGKLYATLVGANSSDVLVEVNPQNGGTRSIGNVGFANVWGITFVGDTLYGLTTSSAGAGSLIRIDTSTGAGTRLRALSFDAFGSTIRASHINHDNQEIHNGSVSKLQ